MKIFSLIIVSLLLFVNASQCQFERKDTALVTHKIILKEYKADSCLSALLADIVASDSLNLEYPPSSFFYELAFTMNEIDKELIISIGRWEKVKHIAYVGVIKIGAMSFLCSGNAAQYQHGLFTEVSDSEKVILKKPVIYQPDKLDEKITDLQKHPALSGMYTRCNGSSIAVFIYVGKALKEYIAR